MALGVGQSPHVSQPIAAPPPATVAPAPSTPAPATFAQRLHTAAGGGDFVTARAVLTEAKVALAAGTLTPEDAHALIQEGVSARAQINDKSFLQTLGEFFHMLLASIGILSPSDRAQARAASSTEHQIAARATKSGHSVPQRR